uniref:Uncharacterized protein n=1 Tax=Hyaloperonospora arabidopsidis (strain Emoy2) TaxID=559515 RepID=M4BYZ6_HYAAE
MNGSAWRDEEGEEYTYKRTGRYRVKRLGTTSCRISAKNFMANRNRKFSSEFRVDFTL